LLLYHGSPTIVEVPTHGIGSVHNDYGQGFYCTESLDLAKEWACPTIADGFANVYEFDMSELQVLYLNKNGYHILNWLAILLDHRTFQKRSPISRQASQYILEEFLPDISVYDVICGYRADDSYFSYAKDFLNNTISVSQLSQAMHLGNLGEQIVLMSPKSFDKISFLKYEIADGSIYNKRRITRDEQARNAYLNTHGTDWSINKGDLFIRDLLLEQVKNDDPRLQ